MIKEFLKEVLMDKETSVMNACTASLTYFTSRMRCGEN